MPHELTIGSRGEPSNFEITVDGTIETPFENPTQGAIIASGSTVEGSVDDDGLEFRVSGTITSISVTGSDAVVSIDGEAVDPVDYCS